MILYIVIFAAVSALFLPLSVKIKFFADITTKKIYYSVYLLSFVRMNSGYISFCEGAVIVHYSDKNAYAAAYNSFKTDINAVDIISSLNFPEVRSEIMLNDYDEFPVLYGICIVRALSAIIYAVLRYGGSYTDFKCNVSLSENSYAGLLNETVIAFNLLTITKIGLKKLKGGK